nr:unnamed protein product [Callosobruchus chinensis]
MQKIQKILKISYDTRGPHSSLAKHWQDTSLEGRAFFRTMMEPSTLSIDNISEKDGGEYHCRIDYYRSPTKNNRVTLTIVAGTIVFVNFHEKTVSQSPSTTIDGKIVFERVINRLVTVESLKPPLIGNSKKKEPIIRCLSQSELMQDTFYRRNNFQVVSFYHPSSAFAII